MPLADMSMVMASSNQGIPLRMHADEYGERPTRTAAPFRVVTTGSSVGRSERLFFEMKRHLRMLPERRRCQEHGTVDLLSQRVPVPTRLPTELLRLRSWSEYEDLRLAIGKRRITGKG